MYAKLVRIGNSQGVRLPKAVIEQVGLGEHLDLEISEGAIVIRPGRGVREDWEVAAALCHQAEDDVFEEWDGVSGDWPGA